MAAEDSSSIVAVLLLFGGVGISAALGWRTLLAADASFDHRPKLLAVIHEQAQPGPGRRRRAVAEERRVRLGARRRWRGLSGCTGSCNSLSPPSPADHVQLESRPTYRG